MFDRCSLIIVCSLITAIRCMEVAHDARQEAKQTTCESCEERLNKQQNKMESLERKLAVVEKILQETTENMGVSYVRWGRTTCPQSRVLVYKGYVGGTQFSDKGGGVNYMCLPENPEWGNKINGVQFSPKMHGAEYQTAETGESIFSQINNAGLPLADLDPLCAVCLVPTRSTQIMIPARRSCPAGWTMEYRGYLVTDNNVYSSKEFVCSDEEPEVMPGSHVSYNGALFYPVEGVCGSLPCPPYVNGWELTCVVCTK